MEKIIKIVEKRKNSLEEVFEKYKKMKNKELKTKKLFNLYLPLLLRFCH